MPTITENNEDKDEAAALCMNRLPFVDTQPFCRPSGYKTVESWTLHVGGFTPDASTGFEVKGGVSTEVPAKSPDTLVYRPCKYAIRPCNSTFIGKACKKQNYSI